MRNEFQIWVDAVCECVRFRPDRKAIAKELRVHYEDHYQDLLRLGRTPEAAAERALNAMGNAQEVGRALDRVHKPWLGWLWEASRWLARALALLALVTLFRTISWETLAERTRGELEWEAPPATAARAELEHGTLWAAPGSIARQPDGTTAAEIQLWIQTRDPLGAGRYHYFGVNSTFFSYQDAQGELPLWELDYATMTWTPVRYWRYDVQKGSMGWTRHRQTIQLVVDQPPRWAEISYPLAGQDWVLRVEWEETP